MPAATPRRLSRAPSSERPDLFLRLRLRRGSDGNIHLAAREDIHILRHQRHLCSEREVPMIIHGRASHIASVGLILVRRRAVHRAPVIPLYEISHIFPVRRDLVFRLLRVVQQVLYQVRRGLRGHTDDPPRVACDVERLAVGIGRGLDEAVVRGRDGQPFLGRRFIEFLRCGQLARMPDPVLGHFSFEQRFDVRGQIVVCGPHVRVHRPAPARW